MPGVRDLSPVELGGKPKSGDSSGLGGCVPSLPQGSEAGLLSSFRWRASVLRSSLSLASPVDGLVLPPSDSLRPPLRSGVPKDTLCLFQQT